jgi:GNAT superfamily N-acetyltransferase
VRFVLTRDVDQFAERAAALLASRVEYNIHASVVSGVIEGRHRSALFAYGVDDEGQVRFAALRTTPWLMLATELEPGYASGLVERWLRIDPELPGVNGLPETTRAIAAAWSEQTGGLAHCRTREAIHVLKEVYDPLRPAPGKLRLPHDHERGIVLEWMHGFATESGAMPSGQVEAAVDWQLARKALFVWDDSGPVSMLALSPAISALARIGPVYTPPRHRSRGYATAMVAAASRKALREGAKACTLFTDLANPTSNRIYAEVGYRRIGDWEEHVFSGRDPCAATPGRASPTPPPQAA